jgi:hypothetical protein
MDEVGFVSGGWDNTTGFKSPDNWGDLDGAPATSTGPSGTGGTGTSGGGVTGSVGPSPGGGATGQVQGPTQSGATLQATLTVGPDGQPTNGTVSATSPSGNVTVGVGAGPNAGGTGTVVRIGVVVRW